MNGRAAGSSDVVSDIVRKAGADMITDLVNQIIWVVPAEQKLSTIVNCY